MDIKKLDALLEEYVKSPKEFQVANYWASYEKNHQCHTRYGF